MERALAWNKLAPEAVSWLMSRTANNEVTGKNMDLSVAFVSEGDASTEGAGEMLIIPQHQSGSLVFGSVFGTLTTDLSQDPSASEVANRQFVVDLRTGEMLQTIWYTSGSVCLVKHVVKTTHEWYNEVVMYQNADGDGGPPNKLVGRGNIISTQDCIYCVARGNPCECAPALRSRVLGPEVKMEFTEWMGWASHFVNAASGTFQTRFSFEFPDRPHENGSSELWWRFSTDMGSDYGTKMLRSQYLTHSGAAFDRLGIVGNSEMIMYNSTASQFTIGDCGGNSSEVKSVDVDSINEAGSIEDGIETTKRFIGRENWGARGSTLVNRPTPRFGKDLSPVLFEEVLDEQNVLADVS
ncbi:hypothetical protein NDN08_002802 [Rhodosorus marinus]|uniref:Amine oxidase n=1 Tax=Rhodosorus marinus TaxID=101924 RepID=A0AAV8UW78_9RHOD|nr:hypothetical protein NDN08_002802 [Rhodosorus marinus]